MSGQIIQYIIYLVVLVGLSIPLGNYIGKVMNGEKVFLTKIIRPIETLCYKILHVREKEEMNWKKYALSAVMFSAAGFVFLFALTLLQKFLPLNPEGISNNSWHLGFNTAASFVTNTNWQSYSGESSLSYLTQMLGLTVQNFVSAGTGMAVLFAFIRGFIRVREDGIGNFWTDLTKSVLYVLLPLSIVVSILIASQGVVQSMGQYEEVQLLEPVITEDGTVITKQMVPAGPAASQVAIKQFGTNGGGFFGVNSAHPFENPTPFSNMVEMISLLLIPVSLCFTFGRNVKDKRQGFAVFLAMFLMLIASLSIIGASEAAGTPQLASNGAVDMSTTDQAGGNMEGKESRFGIASSAAWAAFTTAASNGSVNSMHDSYTPLGGMITMLQMMLGEVIFGGAGCGLYGMLGFALLTVFIAGLMVGRTPEYLGKKIEPREMRMAVLLCLSAPIAILAGSGIAAAVPQVMESLTNGGPHGFSEVLYAFSSAGGNNGSAFAGLSANTPFLNLSLGLVMLFVRFVPMTAALAIAGSLAAKKKVAESAGTLPTHNGLFIGLLILIVLIVGALSFFPALALGPIIEHIKMIG